MKLGEIYKMIVDLGINADPRGKDRVNDILKKSKEEYEKLEGIKKELADSDMTWNPYTDCRILYGKDDREVTSILAGVDITPAEILLADRLNDKGTKIDLVLAHHPHGIGISNLDVVMKLQPEHWAKLGVPIAQAESAMAKRLKQVHWATKPSNHTQTLDAARLIDMPFMCSHTPADSLGHQYLTKFLKDKNPYTLGDMIDNLLEIPEYQSAQRYGAGPEILVGSKDGTCGDKFVFFTGGTSPGPEAIPKLSHAGVSTLITMHWTEELKKATEEEGLYVVIAGHDSSDSIGMNLILDELQKKGIESRTCSGIFRHSRI